MKQSTEMRDALETLVRIMSRENLKPVRIDLVMHPSEGWKLRDIIIGGMLARPEEWVTCRANDEPWATFDLSGVRVTVREQGRP